VIRLGFLGTGWIGRNRMEAMLETGKVTTVGICDSNPEMAQQALGLAPTAQLVHSINDLLGLGVDGVVIATPSAQHADQCVAALDAGVAVFCQKPLGRSAREVERVLAAAERADRLLGVDLSYRHTAAIQAIRQRIRDGDLGQLFAADLTFHNAYGPGAGWFWDPELSGGGCLIDLGVHLVDLGLWMLDFPTVVEAHADLFRNGRAARTAEEVEDFASGTLRLEDGKILRIACSWNLHAGQDAVIEAAFYGTGGSGRMRNEAGSFFNFSAEQFTGRERVSIAAPPDDWGGRAAIEWIGKLAAGERFEGSTTGLLATAEALDRLYGRVTA
jgi:predicted dehydrogenase